MLNNFLNLLKVNYNYAMEEIFAYCSSQKDLLYVKLMYLTAFFDKILAFFNKYRALYSFKRFNQKKYKLFRVYFSFGGNRTKNANKFAMSFHQVPNHVTWLGLGESLVLKNAPLPSKLGDIFLITFYGFFKKTLLALVIALFALFFFFYTFQISFLRFTAGWIIFGLIAYWLLSGFNFFLKRYRFSKFNAAIQRFWKRTLMIFWLTEGFMFSLFVYYILNSSQEPNFIYDQIAIYTLQLIQIDNFLITSLYIVLVLNLIVIVLVKIKTSSLRQLVPYLFFISIFLILILFSESYQFYYVVNFYDDSSWVYSEDENLWELEHDSPRTRTRNHYLSMLILLKFWHYIFIFGSWVFFLMKTFEQNRIRYALFSMNFQNIIIFYLMSWSLMYTWAKFVYRRFFDKTYFWFFLSNRSFYTTVVYHDVAQYLGSLFNVNILKQETFSNVPFYFIKTFDKLSWARGDLLKQYTYQYLI